MVQSLISLLVVPQAVGQTFHLRAGESEYYYHVAGCLISTNHTLTFQVQFENYTYVNYWLFITADADLVGPRFPDMIDLDEFSQMLNVSELVTVG
jgi:hypothetical protein